MPAADSSKIEGLKTEGPEIEEPQTGRAAGDPYRALFDRNPMPMWVFDPATLRFLDVNAAAIAHYGYSRDEFLAMTIADIRPPEDVAKLRANLAGLSLGNKHIGLWRHRLKSGALIEADVTWLPLTLDGQQRVLAVVHDVTRHASAEAALRSSEQRFKHIVELVHEAIWIHDNGIITFANPAAARLFGAGDPAALIGRTIFSFLHPEDRRRAQERTDAMMTTHAALAAVEMRVNGLDGRQRVAELQAVPMLEGDKILIVASGRDVTAQRQAERQLQQAVKMEAVGQLTGGIAHDFNNLLTVIIGSLDLDLAKVPAALRPAIDQAMRAAERGAALTHRLLAFSRQQTLLPGPVDCNKLVAGMGDLLRRTLGEQVEVELRLAPDLKAALADAAQVENALLNLAINARDAMPDGGKLLIETGNQTLDADYVALNPDARAGDYAMLAVSDTGTGMPPEVLAHAFEPFFTTKEVGKGTGLGLAMIYGFARQSGGHARIYSEVGHGTTVRLYLPRLAQAAPAEAAAPAAPAKSGGGETILVVEDDAKVRRLALAQLESLGYRAIEAANGKEALAIVESGAVIDLLFTDVVMPGGMTGVQLAEAATKLRPRLRVLFTSGYAEGSMQHRGVGEPGIKLLSKPYRKQLLAQKIREALDG
ncbi:MAG TPA: PAS domain S-box protein [Alphaproteobacteria bacterium]|nr:PAS domain S-box protein [Alphaproteobacteria bacterium]